MVTVLRIIANLKVDFLKNIIKTTDYKINIFHFSNVKMLFY